MTRSVQYERALGKLDALGFGCELRVERDRVLISWHGHGEEWHVTNNLLNTLPFQLDQLANSVLRWVDARERRTGRERNYAVLDHAA